MRSLAAAIGLLAALGLAWVPVPARAASTCQTFSGPQDNSQLFAYLNSLVICLNSITGPLLPNVPNAVNNISLTGGATGTGAVIGLQPGGDANASIAIVPNGAGNIVLFGQGNTGVLQFGNQSSFVPANGVDACPGAKGIARSLPGGPSLTIRGYFLQADWLGRQYAAVAC